jgi:gallate decarboxylase subunit D
MMRHTAIFAEAGRVRLEMRADLTDEGVNILLVGGDRPHIGGVAMSLPRQSLSGGGPACDTWILPVPSHKDVVVAEKVSKLLCMATTLPVVVTAGIHFDAATRDEIEAVEAACVGMAGDIARWIAAEPA